MTNTTFDEIARVLLCRGFSLQKIAHTPFDSNACELWDASFQQAGLTFRYQVVYLLSSANQSDVSRLKAWVHKDVLPKQVDLQIVYPPSFKLREALDDIASSSTRVVKLSTADYLRAFLEPALTKYIEKFRFAPTHYVDARVTEPGRVGESTATPASLLSQVLDPDGQHVADGARLIAIVAAPGQGKTYYSEWLAYALARRQLIPLYVSSSEWRKIDATNCELSNVVLRALDPAGFSLNTQFKDVEENLISLLLRTRKFVAIFDSFDEYVLRRLDSHPGETVSSLKAMSKALDVPIIFTVRTSFWEGLSSAIQAEATRFDLQPFDTGQAKQYFELKFAGTQRQVELVAAGIQFFAALQKVAKNEINSDDGSYFAGRGYFLPIIADEVLRSVSPPDTDKPVGDQTVVGWMVTTLCEREDTRQELKLTIAHQKEFFCEYAYYILHPDRETFESYRLTYECTAPGGSTPDQARLLIGGDLDHAGQLLNHPLIQFNRGSVSVRFASEQIWSYFLALRPAQLLQSGALAQAKAALQELFRATTLEVSLADDVAEYLADEVFFSVAPEGRVASLEQLVALTFEALSNARSEASPISPVCANWCDGFATKLAFRATDLLVPRARHSQTERTNVLTRLLPAQMRFRRLTIRGPIRKLDFAGVTFAECAFINVLWDHCRFDAATQFIRCDISSWETENSTGENMVMGESNRLELPNGAPPSLLTARSDPREISQQLLSEILRKLVALVYSQDTRQFQSVRESEILAIGLLHLKDRTVVQRMLGKHLWETHEEAQGQIRYSIRADAQADIRFYSENGRAVGKVRDLILAVGSEMRTPKTLR